MLTCNLILIIIELCIALIHYVITPFLIYCRRGNSYRILRAWLHNVLERNHFSCNPMYFLSETQNACAFWVFHKDYSGRYKKNEIRFLTSFYHALRSYPFGLHALNIYTVCAPVDLFLNPCLHYFTASLLYITIPVTSNDHNLDQTSPHLIETGQNETIPMA